MYNKYLLIYFMLTGVITFLWFFHGFNYSKHVKEAEDIIADVTWDTGIKREYVKAILYAVALFFGWLILPYKIVNGIIKGEE